MKNTDIGFMKLVYSCERLTGFFEALIEWMGDGAAKSIVEPSSTSAVDALAIAEKFFTANLTAPDVRVKFSKFVVLIASMPKTVSIAGEREELDTLEAASKILNSAYLSFAELVDDLEYPGIDSNKLRESFKL